MNVKISIWATMFLFVLAAVSIAISIADHNWLLLASGTWLGLLAILTLGYVVTITNTRIEGQAIFFAIPISKWNIDLSKARGYYFLPKWLGPLSVLMITDGKKYYVITPALKNKKSIIRHLEYHMRNIAA